MNIAYNTLAGGTCLEDIELRRNDAAYLDALGAQRIPDPTTAGDFTRRFSEKDLLALMEAVNAIRVKLWKKRLSRHERREAILDVDGTLAPTDGECKEGMGLSYNGVWSYHPLMVSLANTLEPLYLTNPLRRSSSHRPAVRRSCHTIALCSGFPVFGSQQTTVSRWLVTPTATISSARTLATASAITARVVSQISSGIVLDPPRAGETIVEIRGKPTPPPASRGRTQSRDCPWCPDRWPGSTCVVVSRDRSRKMLGEQPARRADAMNHSLRELTLSKVVRHRPHNLFPEPFPALRVHRLVSDDRKVL